MTIVFDLDNTLVDSFGASLRPGIKQLLSRLRAEGHTLVLWTNSRRERALDILRLHGLRLYFATCICREDYDPEEKDIPKDIRTIQGDILIDDDPQAIAYARSTGRKAILIRPFRKGQKANLKELAALYDRIRRSAGFWGKLTR